jgi:hypothetical protein
LAIEQGKFVEEQFIKPYQKTLEQWAKATLIKTVLLFNYSY